ncbi:AmmeMemoRadiSam system radical SAM enzyme [Actinomadura sp. ATCC 31491]|uniref:AmmeMemoRadiSam system radical SAM enzyme n=1 Tax=Actinomadura luzonensis TaxID=2805427 RepID=A0ABT0FKC0_9ACTN|nr:AmmeMemoRadiSam system radical SAM enzyme [Actinomadura luzonensis]MCK2212398.1 AmmeMemoRadiSam system radical SAM enzyme [Actinomadura luzonensis]
MPLDERTHAWQETGHEARLWSKRDDGVVQCHLSPRNCVIREGRAGFCRVRVNRGGELQTLNYGKSVAMTEETIETEAVNHYAPGAKILSMGNVGCMMNCDYCHNWNTSQARFVTDDVVHTYTPEQVVESALARGIKVISWTYNDPVVWHEFILDTAALAREHGLINLYKSAFYISLEGATELVDVMDIFSISLKSMDPVFYKRFTKGRLQPVLDATQYVYQRGRHVEISNLVVTEANDKEEDARKVAEWVATNLSPEVPLHFVRFHPDYKYTHVGRTPIERLERAREVAFEVGMKYVYLGNVYDNPASNSYCPNCKNMVVSRYGLIAKSSGLTADACCTGCGAKLPFVMLPESSKSPLEVPEVPATDLERRDHFWRGDVRAVHVEVRNEESVPRMVRARVLGGPNEGTVIREVPVLPNSDFRFICSKADPDDIGVTLEFPRSVGMKSYEVYDRAHFPTLEVEAAPTESDSVPLPVFLGVPSRRDE